MRDAGLPIFSGGGDVGARAPFAVRYVRQRVRHAVRHQVIDFKRCAACAAYTRVVRMRARVPAPARAHACARACLPHMTHIPHSRATTPCDAAHGGARHGAQVSAFARDFGFLVLGEGRGWRR
jgi:hypothetical protein